VRAAVPEERRHRDDAGREQGAVQDEHPSSRSARPSAGRFAEKT
jgi:hypothetical protein